MTVRGESTRNVGAVFAKGSNNFRVTRIVEDREGYERLQLRCLQYGVTLTGRYTFEELTEAGYVERG